jgi:hypothetical protein
MFHDVDHPRVPLSDWQTFKNCPPRLIGEVIDRTEAQLPDWFVPLARGVALPSDALLRSVGYRDGMSCPSGWDKTHCDVFERDNIDLKRLKVRQCSNQGLWTVERWRDLWRPYVHSDEVLVHDFGSTPIFTRSYQSAMQLAMHCELKPPLGLRWIAACPPKYQDAINERRVNELLAL